MGRREVEAWKFAATGVLLAIAVGAVVVTLAVFAARVTQHGLFGTGSDRAPSAADIAATQAQANQNPLQPPGPPPPGLDLKSPAASFVLAAPVAGFVSAGLVAWFVLAPLGTSYRRGAFAMAAAIGTMLPMLLAAALDMAFRQPGLLALVAFAIGTAVVSGRRLADMEIRA